MKALHEHMDPNFLPSNYGGNLPKLDYTSSDWFPVACGHLDHIRRWNTYGFAKKTETEKK